jgi:hypothetical protein
MRWLPFLVIIAVLMAPSFAHAEVMDKEASSSEIWVWAVVGGISAAVAWRIRIWLGLLVTAPVALFFAELWDEISDPVVGRAIRAETGAAYVATAIQATVVVVGLVLIAAFTGLQSNRGR